VSISELAGRLGGWPRRILALCCLLLAGVTSVGARHTSAAPAGHPIVVAVRDLATGTALTSADVRLRSWPDDLRPAGGLTRPDEAIGRRIASAVRAGEALTATRLIGPGLTTGLPRDLRAVPVQVGGGGPGLVRAGDFVDLLVSDPPDAVAPSPPVAHVLAESARVLAVTAPPSAPGDDVGTLGVGTLEIVIAVDRATSLKIAAVSGRALVATVRNPP
jgi:Flp pilus assembly protein CpaB